MGLGFRVALCFALVTTSGAIASQQQESTLGGVVVDAISGRGVAGVEVYVSSDNGQTRLSTVRGDDQGRFRFALLPSGTYMVRAIKAGYSGGVYGLRSPELGGAPRYVTVGTQSPPSSIRLRLWQSAVIAGSVEIDGQPVQDLAVRALRRTFVAGYERFSAVATGKTDDRGAYRLSNLTPGTYLVAVSAGRGQAGGFFPGAVGAGQAQPLDVNYGDELQAINIAVSTQSSATTSVSGTLIGGEDRAVSVRLIPQVTGFAIADFGGSDFGVLHGIVDQGRFRLDQVPAGTYVLRAISFPQEVAAPGTVRALQRSDGRVSLPNPVRPLATVPTGDTLFAEEVVVVGSQAISNLTVPLLRGGRIEGRVVVESANGQTGSLQEQVPAVSVVAADGRDIGQFPVARVEPDGRFTTVGLPHGKFLLRALGPTSWNQRPISIGGAAPTNGVVAVRGTDIEEVLLVLSDRGKAVVAGFARDASGRPSDVARIYAFPSDRRSWLDFGEGAAAFVRVDPAEDGAFQLQLPPGSYYMAASAMALPESWKGPQIFDRLVPLARVLTVEEGQSQNLDLVVR